LFARLARHGLLEDDLLKDRRLTSSTAAEFLTSLRPSHTRQSQPFAPRANHRPALISQPFPPRPSRTVPAAADHTFFREDKMKKIALMIVVLGLSLLPFSVHAAQIFGSLKEDGRSIPAKVVYEVLCGAQKYVGETDGYGAYVFNAGRGKCTFKVYYKGQAPSFDVYSYDDPVRYDFDLILQSNGQYMLRRR
jgi:hypothetical protein